MWLEIRIVVTLGGESNQKGHKGSFRDVDNVLTLDLGLAT